MLPYSVSEKNTSLSKVNQLPTQATHLAKEMQYKKMCWLYRTVWGNVANHRCRKQEKMKGMLQANVNS